VAGFGDFSGNAGETDMLMRNNANGEFYVYDINNNQITGSYNLGNVGLSWTVAGFGDFSGNAGEIDMLMRNTGGNGEFYLFDINNNQIAGSHDLGDVGLSWNVAGFGGFSGNSGETDMLMRNTGGNGEFYLFDINNNQITGSHDLGDVGLSWNVAGLGNFSGNLGETDMLMRNSANGEFYLFDISNNHITGSHDLGDVGLSWTVAGFGDFSGNAGETDMLMRNTGGNGEFYLFDINNNQITGSHDLGDVGLSWTVAGFGDFSGNAGETDMLMRNTGGNGEFYLFDINNNQIAGSHDLGGVGLAWSISGITSDPPSAASTSQLMQAVASFGASGGANTTPSSVIGSSDPSQQSLLTLPQHG
jgi:hypothetical protein